MSDLTCSIAGCESPRRTRGWCGKHYGRWLRHGDPEAVLRVKGDVLGQLARHFQIQPDGCWRWTGAKNERGYGRVTIAKVAAYAHRAAYTEAVGPIPDGLHLDHLCRNPSCINPDHLEPVTPLENTRRGVGHGSETHCPQGHPYAGENLYVHTDKRGYRRRTCRTCKAEALRRFHAKARR